MTPRRKQPPAETLKKAPGFYAEALSAAERMRLPKARNVEGIDEEIALLRVDPLTRPGDQPGTDAAELVPRQVAAGLIARRRAIEQGDGSPQLHHACRLCRAPPGI